MRMPLTTIAEVGGRRLTKVNCEMKPDNTFTGDYCAIPFLVRAAARSLGTN